MCFQLCGNSLHKSLWAPRGDGFPGLVWKSLTRLHKALTLTPSDTSLGMNLNADCEPGLPLNTSAWPQEWGQIPAVRSAFQKKGFYSRTIIPSVHIPLTTQCVFHKVYGWDASAGTLHTSVLKSQRKKDFFFSQMAETKIQTGPKPAVWQVHQFPSLSTLTTVLSVNPLDCIHSARVSIQHSDNSPLLRRKTNGAFTEVPNKQIRLFAEDRRRGSR